MPCFQRLLSRSSVSVSVKTASVLPFRNAVLVRAIWANGPVGPVGWRASFPRIPVGRAPGVLATATKKMELDPI